MEAGMPAAVSLCVALGLMAAAARGAEMDFSVLPVGVRTGECNIGNSNSPVATFNGAVYVAFVRPDPETGRRYETVVGRHDGSGWQFSVVEPNGFNDPWHAQPSLCVDADGYVHVTCNMHSSYWQYSVSKRPEDIGQWEFRGQELQGPHNEARSSWDPSPGTADIPGNRITYQFMTTDRNGIPYICYRESLFNEPGVGYFRKQWSLGVARYDPATRTWDRVGPDGGVFPFATEPGYRGQGGQIFFDAANRMHVSWIFYKEYESDGSGHLKPNYPCYARSDDGGLTWRKADGTPLSLPIGLDEADVVLDPSWCEPNTKGYFSGYTHLVALPDGTPIVHLAPKEIRPGRHRALLAWEPGSGWSEPRLTPYAATRVMVDDAGVLSAASSGLRIHRSHDAGRTWQTWDVDLDNGPMVIWPDYSYTPRHGGMRILTQSQKTGGLQIYTFEFHE
jgi:hypothetical protein